MNAQTFSAIAGVTFNSSRPAIAHLQTKARGRRRARPRVVRDLVRSLSDMSPTHRKEQS